MLVEIDNSVICAPVLFPYDVHYLGDFPLGHICALMREYQGDITDVVERLECDGWSPAEIANGAADPASYPDLF